jgi:hypothetical protein
LSFPKERQLIDNILGADGKIKGYMSLFKDGKLVKPEGVSSGGPNPFYADSPFTDTYDKLT